jgi:hypothetical protein
LCGLPTTPRRIRSQPAPNLAHLYLARITNEAEAYRPVNEDETTNRMEALQQTVKCGSDLSVNVTGRRRSVFAEPLFIDDSQSPICEFRRNFWEQ